MGAGKSTIGQLVAARIGLPFGDLDALVVADAGGIGVPEIFSREGERGFRVREARALRAACTAPPHVLALGGGTLHQPGALEIGRAHV